MINKYTVGLVLAGAVGLLCLMALHLSVPAHASVHVPDPVCDEGLHVGNPHCLPSPTPTASPTATPTATPRPTHTPRPCIEHHAYNVHDNDWDDCPQVSPTPSASPSASPSATPDPTTPPATDNSGSGGDNSQVAIVCSAPQVAAKLQGFGRDQATGDVTFNWWPSTDPNVVSQSIVFGYDENNLNMGQNGLPKEVSSFTIHGLAPQVVWAQIWSYTDGGCVIKSNKLDP